jgi:hypothetical protein
MTGQRERSKELIIREKICILWRAALILTIPLPAPKEQPPRKLSGIRDRPTSDTLESSLADFFVWLTEGSN